ncbi:hypothetical protein DNTS_004367 [Danionella cerebrum]|uniref:VWFA domain-containing protein n=1 Tax=Danionella cerebrum TaxID=2873325 RepID=A0A553P949_9TELE|nr:hypothetical protein DNTS_004367 [Danionella translucida]
MLKGDSRHLQAQEGKKKDLAETTNSKYRYIHISITFSLFTAASQSVTAFNIDPSSWKSFSSPAGSRAVSFGYKVLQKDSLSLIVSDPLIQTAQDRRGEIYDCLVSKETCSSKNIKVPLEAVNMSLGLSMVQHSQSSKLAICGPTIPKTCPTITTYNGMCLTLETSGGLQSIPSSLRDCRNDELDIAFLLDGSGSVRLYNFDVMKTFVRNVIKQFVNRDAQQSYCSPLTPSFCSPNSRNELFTLNSGLRPSAKKILVVITDGQSSDRIYLENAASLAKNKNIIRFAIGVGNAFTNNDAKAELDTIASDPDADYVFRVNDFNALDTILQKLEDNIIAIEGELRCDSKSIDQHCAGSLLMSVVGAYQWKGGYKEYIHEGTLQTGTEHESYQGYSLVVASVRGTSFAIQGAPRFQHKGKVIVSKIRSTESQTLDSPTPQVGSYFGAEVCVVDLNRDSYTDLLLVSAPTHTESDQEGKVFVYNFMSNPFFDFSRTVLMGMTGQRGRFGSSLASPADLNGDGFMDVLVGAPLEEDGQGSIYVFNGGNGVIIPAYSQRITGSSVKPGLSFFGVSLSPSSQHQPQDSLPYVAVGSKGEVLLLRSRPIMHLDATVKYNPSKISTAPTDCAKPMENTLDVCFKMTGYKHRIQGLSAKISFNITLDAKRQKYRAYFTAKNRLFSNEMVVEKTEACQNHKFYIEACSEDALNPLANQLTFSFEGLPSDLRNPRPLLLPEIKTTADYNLDFERDCGADNVCIDELRIDFNFSGSTSIEVGIMQEINVTVSVENNGENSYNTLFKLEYPYGLSYRRISLKQGRVECASLDGEQGVRPGSSSCHISKPILKDHTQVVFEITYIINKESTLGQIVTFIGSVESGNDRHSTKSELSINKSIDVKYGIYVAMTRHENSTIHVNFTSGKNDLSKAIQQKIKIENDFRALGFSVFIRVPLKLGEADIWKNSTLQIPDCAHEATEPAKLNHSLEVIKKQRVVNCSVAECAVFRCDVNLIRNERKFFNISGNVSSAWIEQTGFQAAVFELVSAATIVYDKSKYVFFSSESRDTAPSLQISTQVEVYKEVDLTIFVIGGVIGGLLLLALITAAFIKAGFFKSHFKQMLEEAQGAEGGEQ